jgi:hypothetical protein
MTKVQERKITTKDRQYSDIHSKEHFIKTREKFIYDLKDAGGLSEDDLKMVEEVWGQAESSNPLFFYIKIF